MYPSQAATFVMHQKFYTVCHRRRREGRIRILAVKDLIKLTGASLIRLIYWSRKRFVAHLKIDYGRSFREIVGQWSLRSRGIITLSCHLLRILRRTLHFYYMQTEASQEKERRSCLLTSQTNKQWMPKGNMHGSFWTFLNIYQYKYNRGRCTLQNELLVSSLQILGSESQKSATLI